jgi:hypothetical protein
MDKPWVIVQLRQPGEFIPEGLSLTETVVAWYVRIRHGCEEYRIRIPISAPERYTYERLWIRAFADYTATEVGYVPQP